MGRGDKKTKKGKIFKGSFGKSVLQELQLKQQSLQLNKKKLNWL
jgi:ribosomal small subunit protein bTHX